MILHLILASSGSPAATDVGNTTQWWVPVLTFVGGAGVTLGVAFLGALSARDGRRQDSAERRADREAERTARAGELAAARLDEHRERQRVSLTELQEQASDWIRACGEAHAQDLATWRAAGQPLQYPAGYLGRDLDERLNTLQRRVMVLSERVDQPAVRAVVDEMVTSYDAIVHATTRGAAEGGLTAIGTQFLHLNALIGAELRRLPT